MADSDWLHDGLDQLDEREYPDEDEDYDEDDVAWLPCPECGEEIDEELVQCPYCGEYITHGHSLWSGRSATWIVLGVLGIVAVVVALLFGL
jgi:hypothetical protein